MERKEKVIIIGDTHSHFEILHSVYEKETIDSNPLALLHCGDIGVYDSENMERLPDKEMRLIERHKNQVEQFLPYLKKEIQFPLPVFGIAGNHEDFDLFCEIAEHKVVIPNFELCKYVGGLHQIELGKKEFRVFGFGKTMPQVISFEKNRNKPSMATTEEWKTAFNRVKKAQPDILLLHEPPKLPFPESSSTKGRFGSWEITELIKVSGAKMAFIGHMHFEYETMIGSVRVYGLGYGAAGHYVTLDENENVTFKKLKDTGELNIQNLIASVKRS